MRKQIVFLALTLVLSACFVTPTLSRTPTEIVADTPTASASATLTPTTSPVASPTRTAQPSNTPIATKTATATPRPTSTASATRIPPPAQTDVPTRTPRPTPEGCTVTVPASQRFVKDLTEERICFDTRTNGVSIRNVHMSLMGFSGVTISASQISIRDSSALTLQNVTVHASGSGNICIQAFSIPDLTIINADLRGCYIGIHHNVNKALGPNDSLGTMKVIDTSIDKAFHESIYLGDSSFDESKYPAFELLIVKSIVSTRSGWDGIQISGCVLCVIERNVISAYGMNPQDGDPDGQTKGITIQKLPSGGLAELISNRVDGTISGGHGIKIKSGTTAYLEGNRVVNAGLSALQIKGRASGRDNIFTGYVDKCIDGRSRWTDLGGNECRR